MIMYYDYAGLGVPLSEVLTKEYEYKIQMANNPTLEKEYENQIEFEKEKILNNFFRAKGYRISYVRNATEGTTIIANSLKLRNGDEILISNLEHRSSVNTLYLVCEKGNCSIKEVIISPSDTSRTILRKFENAISKKTKVIFISHVDRNFGIIFPVKEISALAAVYNLISIIDGTQAVGLIDVNLNDINCDVYICSFHKWCCLPPACGAILAKERIYNKFDRLYVGGERLGKKRIQDREFGGYELGTRNIALEMCLPMILCPKESSENWVDEYIQGILEQYDDISLVSSIRSNGYGFFVLCTSQTNNFDFCETLAERYNIFVGKVFKYNNEFLRISYMPHISKNDINNLFTAIQNICSKISKHTERKLTMIKNVLFTGDTLSDEERALWLNKGFNIIPASYDLDESSVAELLLDCDGYILGGDEIASKKLLEKAGDRLKCISFFGAGYEKYVDTNYCSERGIKVTNTPGANSDSVAEFTVALLLSAVKGIPVRNNEVKNGIWNKPKTFDVAGKTIGIIGMGNIGRRVARILHNGFGANIIYTSRTQKPEIDEELSAKFVTLSELLSKSDIISINASYSESTCKMISSAQFSSMKKGVIIVNTARAEFLDKHALEKAINDGIVACCAMDVFYSEPIDNSLINASNLLKMSDDKFIITPHTAYYTFDALRKMEEMAIENVVAVLDGKNCANIVN